VPLPNGFVNVPFNDVPAIKAATSSKTCAVMLEPIQGEGGVNVPADDYLKQVRAWCDEKGILLILDEVQTGLGRIGALFGYQVYGVEPDIMTLAKGLGNGVPVGAILCKEKASAFKPGEHGSTYGGNPLACAAAYATVKYVLEHDIAGNARRVGDYLMAELLKMKSSLGIVKGVRGRGLLVAMQLHQPVAQDVVTKCMKLGLLLNKVKPDTIRFIPPLIIGLEEVDEALGTLKTVLRESGGQEQCLKK